MTTVRVLTYADYAALPDEGKRYEILDGELVVTPAPSRNHQRVVLRLAGLLDAHVTAENVGEAVILAPGLRRCPYARDRGAVAVDRAGRPEQEA